MMEKSNFLKKDKKLCILVEQKHKTDLCSKTQTLDTYIEARK